MKKTIAMMLAVSLLMVGGAATVSAGDGEAKVYVVHGIPGDEGFPVDVSVNGECALPGFTFGEREGPLALPAGEYEVAVHAPSDVACGGDAAIGPVTLPFEGGDNKTVIAHLDEEGNATASVFDNDVSRFHRIQSRLVAHHAAAAPEVDVIVARKYGRWGPQATFDGFANGDQISADLRPGVREVTLELDGEPVFGPTKLRLRPFVTYSVYAVGTFPDTFQYLVFQDRNYRFR
jgi:hypothetical protein